jgi:tetratricopeptide (TPR) repeat protein
MKINIDKFNFLDKISSNKISYAVILIFAVTVYSKSISCGFVGFDDIDILQNLDAIGSSISPLESFRRDAVLSTQGNAFYRPMQGMTLIMDYSISGLAPKSYHVTNLIIHILTCMGLLYLLKMLGFDKVISFLMTLLFTVHPLFNQTVAWVPARGDLLIGLFGILSIIALIKFFEGGKWLFLAAHLAAFFISVFSKESTILFPIVYAPIYCLGYYKKDGTKLINMKKLSLIAGWILIIAFYLYLRSTVIKTILEPEHFGIMVFLSNIWVMPEIIAKFFIPIKLNCMPKFSVLISSLGILIIAGMTYFSILKGKDFNYLSFIGIAWFVIFNAITMAYRHNHELASFDYLEHRTYLPSIGLIILILSLIKDSWKVRLIYFLIPLIFIYSVYSFENTKKFQDPLAFYNTIIDDGTNLAIAYYGRGVYKGNNGNQQGAIEDYSKAISIKKDYAAAYYNRGNIEREMKEYETAIDDYTKAIKANPRFADAYLNRGLTYIIINRREEAIGDYNKAIKINPKNPDAYNNLGLIYGKEGNYSESIEYFSKSIECDNKFGDAYKNRGLAYLFLGNKQKAYADFKLSMECGSDIGKQLYEKYCR